MATRNWIPRRLHPAPASLEVMAGDYRKALATPDHVFMPWSLAQKFFGGMEAVGKTFLHNGTKELTVAAIYRDVPSNSLFRNYLYSLSFCSGVRWSQWNYDTYYVLPDGTDKQMLVNIYSGRCQGDREIDQINSRDKQNNSSD